MFDNVDDDMDAKFTRLLVITTWQKFYQVQKNINFFHMKGIVAIFNLETFGYLFKYPKI